MHFVGNTMIDSLVAPSALPRAAIAATSSGSSAGDYLLVTLHRPALVDGPLLDEVLASRAVAASCRSCFPPIRARARLDGRGPLAPGIHVLDPLGYLDFLSLEADAAAVLTDSGGVQEETTYLGVPCFTLRDNTERPITIRAGTNTLLGLAAESIADIPAALASLDRQRRPAPEGWDGHAAERIADVIATALDAAQATAVASPILV